MIEIERESPQGWLHMDCAPSVMPALRRVEMRLRRAVRDEETIRIRVRAGERVLYVATVDACGNVVVTCPQMFTDYTRSGREARR